MENTTESDGWNGHHAGPQSQEMNPDFDTSAHSSLDFDEQNDGNDTRNQNFDKSPSAVTDAPPDHSHSSDDNNNGDDNNNDDDDEQLRNSQLIREATAAAVDDATMMKRSDSILSESENENDESRSSSQAETLLPPPLEGLDRRISSASARYMEEASFEASMLSPGLHQLAPSGRQHTSSSRDIIDLRNTSMKLDDLDEQDSTENASGDGDDDSELRTPRRRQKSERALFSGGSKLFPASDAPLLDTIVSVPSGEENSPEEPERQELSQVLESCGLRIPTTSSHFPEEVVLLHATFEDFCKPPLSLESVEGILEMERGRGVGAEKLPLDVVIQKPSTVLVQLLGPPLLLLPKHFAMALFRIILRLLTNDTDSEYDSAILTSCTWYDETFASSPIDLQTMATRQRTSSSTSLKKHQTDETSFNRSSEARKADQMYTMVRLRRNWTTAVTQMLRLLESVLHDDKKLDYLQAPITRLLGLLCAGGISVDELRHILALATETEASPLTQLLLVRALQTAAAGASRSSLLVGKASPRTFFSFVSGPGIVRTINLEKSSWPFKNDFGMALWFRAECFKDSSTLLRVTNQSGNGVEVSLLPLSKETKSSATATVLAISILEAGKPIHCIKVSQCILHERVWYHVAVRHTRSRLKGVFSLGSREQVSVMLDGKTMVTEPLKFPHISDSASKSLSLTFGANFDGQTGAIYVFHDNVSDATFKSLYGTTAGTNGLIYRKAPAHGEWDSRRGDIVKKSKVLDLSMRRDDVEDIVISQRSESKENLSTSAVVDLEEDDESFESSPLSKAAFNSRLYLVWDPRRTEGTVALELHSGAHARMDPSNVQPWTVEGAQDVISSIGGVQALLPIFRSLLSGDLEKKWTISEGSKEKAEATQMLERTILCSCIPDLFLLLASFVRDNNENAREMLRCGGVDIIEQLLHANKKLGWANPRLPAGSLVAAACTFPSLASLLVKSLLEVRSACSHYVGLETKVFSQLLFNLPLWFGGLGPGVSLYPALIPALSSVTKNNPEKVRDCVGIKDMIRIMKELVEFQVRTPNWVQAVLFLEYQFSLLRPLVAK
jgi:hypothetical protein